MSDSSQRPPFVAYIAREPISRVLQKDILGRSYVRFLPFLIAGLQLYTLGAVLGHAQRDKFEILANLLYDKPQPANELKSVTNDLTNLAKKRLDSCSKAPDSFFDLFMNTELKAAGLSFEMPLKEFQKTAKIKLLLKRQPGPTDMAEMFVMEGIAFGARFPGLTERLWKKSSEIDSGEWKKWRERGLDIGEQPTRMTLDEAEQEILRGVAIYVSQYYPELAEPLGLQLV